MSKRMSGIVNRGLSKVLSNSKAVAGAVAVAAITMATTVVRADAPTLPSTGVEVGTLVGLTIVALGAIVATIVGGHFAFKLIRFALRWVGKVAG